MFGPMDSLLKGISGPWTATRLGTVALAVACIVGASLLPSTVLMAGVTSTAALGSLAFFLLGMVVKGPGSIEQALPPIPKP